MIDRCDKCKEFIYSWQGEHKCKPLWLCCINDGSDVPDDEKEFEYDVRAMNAAAAAEKCAEEEESSWDHSFVDSGGVKIDVKNPKTGKIVNFYVIAEPMIQYNASELETDNDSSKN